MHIFIFLLLLCFYSPTDALAPSLTPTYRVVAAPTYDHSLTLANLLLPLSPPSSPPSDLFLPAESFLCPPSDLCAPSPPSCPCDFTLPCPTLPACCATDPESAPAFAAACGPNSLPHSWATLSPSEPLQVVLTASAARFRYHPSAESLCKGFAISLRPDPAASAASLAFSAVALVSFSTPFPETDPFAVRISFTPDAASELRQHVRLCPSSSLTLGSSGFIGATNHRTAFVAIFSTAFNQRAVTLYPTFALLSVAETRDVSSLPQAVPFGSLQKCALPIQAGCVPDGASVFASLQDSESHSVLFVFSGASCAVLSADVRTLASGNADLYAAYASETTAPSFQSATWWSRKQGADSLDFYVCPGDRVALSVAMAAGGGPGVYVLTLSSAAPVVELNIRTDVNTLLLPPYFVGSSRLVCDDPGISSYRKTASGQALFSCLSWFGKYQEDCQIFYPVLSAAFQNPLFPAIPSVWQDPVDYYALNLTRLFAVQPVVPDPSAFQAAVVLSAVTGPSLSAYISPQQLPSCRVEFTSRLRDASFSVLQGISPSFELADSHCTAEEFSDALLRVYPYYDLSVFEFDYSWFASYAFIGVLLYQEPALADCLRVSETLRVQEVTEIQPPNLCDDPLDACCQNRLPVTLLYQDCALNPGVSLTDFSANASLVAAQCPDFSQCQEAIENEVGSLSAYSTGQDIDKCRGNTGLARSVNAQILPYVTACRASLLGPDQMGFQCLSDAECPFPGFSCVYDAATLGAPYREGRCLASAFLLDQLLFQCLAENLPFFLEQVIAAVLGIPTTDPRFIPSLYYLWTGPGCGSLFPAQYTDFSSVHYQLDATPSACSQDRYCPAGLLCSDAFCPAPHTCGYPFSSCAHQWTPVQDFFLTEQTCLAHFRCNVLSPSGQPIACADPATCAAVCPSGGTFCGYCADGDAVCYEMPGPTCPTQACLIQGLNQLLPLSQCQDAETAVGYCTIPDATQSTYLATQAECEARSLCAFHDIPLTGGFCLGAPSGFGVACPGSVSSPVGCILVDPITGVPLVSQAQCKGADPNYPLANLTWIPAITSAAECLDNPALRMCVIPSGLYPTFYPEPLCAQFGGSIQPVFSHKVGRFSPGEVVDLSPTLPRVLLPQTNYSATRLKVSNLYGTAYATSSLMTALDLSSQSVCRLSAPPISAAFITSCLCTNASSGDGICDTIFASMTKPPPSFLGVGYICTLVSNTIDMGTFTLTSSVSTKVTSSKSSDVNCIAVSPSYSSCTLFFHSRKRTRATDFYVARQDTYIPPLGAINSHGNVVGLIISDGLDLTDLFHFDDTISNVTLCMRVRSDFIQFISGTPELAKYVSGFQIGVITPDFKLAHPIHNAQPSVVYRAGTSFNGTAFESLEYIDVVCNYFEYLPMATTLVALAISDNVNDDSNGFTTEQNNVMIATATFYLVPLAFLLLPLLILLPISRGRSAFNLNYWCLSALAIFFLLRAVLLFCFVGGSISPNTTAEFALSAFATLALFFALFFAGFCILHLMVSTNQTKSFGSASAGNASTFFVVGGVNVVLILILIGFLIAVGVTESNSSDLSTVYVNCLGRVNDHQEFWSTVRIIRFTFSSIITFVTLLLSLFLFYLIYILSKSERNSSILRLIVSNLIAAFALLIHSIIALILLGTDYNNFAFEISMLWLTEIVPYSIYIILTSWNLQKTFYSAFTISGSLRASGSRSKPSR